MRKSSIMNTLQSTFILFSILIGSAFSSNFFVATPQRYRAGDIATVFVTVDKTKNSSVLRVDLSYGVTDGYNHLSSIYTDLIPDQDTGSALSLVKFNLSSNAKGKAKVTVRGIDGTSTKELHVPIAGSQGNIFIQTDKPVYKPGGKLRFRVVVVDKDLKPANEALSLVHVLNPSGSRMMQWTNLTLIDGIVSLEIPISIKPVLGEWKISATYKKWTSVQTIKVDKYVLPKFEVTIKPPPYLLRSMATVPITVCAKYTYGKQVAGDVEVKVCPMMFKKTRCVLFNKKIDGCADISYTAPSTLNKRYFYYKFKLSIHASVTENATGSKANASHTTDAFQRHRIKLRFDAPKYYKPGFRYKVQLFATTPDGRPTTSELVKLTVLNNHGRVSEKTVVVKNGLHEFHVFPLSDTERYYYNAEHLPGRELPLWTMFLLKTKRFGGRSYYNKATASATTNAWYSRGNQYVEIRKMDNLEVGKTAKFNIKFSDNRVTGKSLKYLIVCKGKIMVADQVKIETTHLHLHVPVTHELLPQCKMLVFYINNDGEFIADSKKVVFQMSYKNKVSLAFAENARKPGQQIDLLLKASPGSKFALSAVDRSVQLLGQTSDLRETQILKMLHSQDNPPSSLDRKCNRRSSLCRRWWGCHYSTEDRVDGLKAIEDSSLLYSSNADIDVLPCPKIEYQEFFTDTRMFALASGGRPGPRVLNERIPLTRVLFKETKGKKINTKEKEKKLPSKSDKVPLKIRTEFPETWLWQEETISSTGEKVLNVKVPDTITTWYANGFAISQSDGIGVAAPASIKAFQPFFVATALPYSVIRGESVKIPVSVFNYLDDCLVVQLSLMQSTQYNIKGQSSIKLCVCGSKSKTYKFSITPKMLGNIDITVKAISLAPDADVCGADAVMTEGVTAADAMTKKLLVEAEGIKKEISTSTFFCPRDHGGIFRDSFALYSNEPIVPGSVYAELSVVGDMMGPSMDNIDKLLAMPYGCGEQNMLKFAPNIYIMDYLTATNQVTDKIKNKALEFMRSGYQRELTYKHNDGAYSAFGRGVGSTWLTAFVLRSYAQAKRYIFIDDKDIEDSKRWLLGLQEPSGCFKELGMVHHGSMKGGVTSGITMTAFVLNALLEAGVKRHDRRIQKALSCVTKGLDKVTDPYTASILAYTLTLASSDKRWEMLDLLKSMEKKNDGIVHWEEARKRKDFSRFYCYYPAPSADIEMTAYALLSYIGGRKKFGSPLEQLKIVKWLIKQRNSYGGFSSTQDTIIALMALSQYSAGAFSEDYALDIATNAPGFSRTFKVKSDNKLLLQRSQIPSIPVNISIEATGRGCALVQASVKYNVPDPSGDPSFYLKVDVEDDRTFTCKHTMKVCGSYTGNGKSNMALIDVTMVSGFEPLLNELDMSMQSTNAAFSYYEFQNGILSFYFDEFDATSKCIEFGMEQVAEVTDRKPASVKIYDYYDTDLSATMKYEVGNCPEVNAV